MKALKNDCTIYVEQILKEINNCYSDNTPTNIQLMELYSFIGKYICEQGEKAFYKKYSRVRYSLKMKLDHYPVVGMELDYPQKRKKLRLAN